MDRREYLIAVGAAGTATIAGCSSGDGDNDESDDGTDESDDEGDIQDTDGDGVIDSEDYAPNDPDVQREEQVTVDSDGDDGNGETDNDDSDGRNGGDRDSADNRESGGDGSLEDGLKGPTREDNTVVDIQYKSFSQSNINKAKSEAREVGYRELFRNIDDYKNEVVRLQGQIIQVIEGYEEGSFIFLIAINRSVENLVYASWVGDRYLKQDQIELWGLVLGSESYQTGMGGENTVPAIAIADMQMQ